MTPVSAPCARMAGRPRGLSSTRSRWCRDNGGTVTGRAPLFTPRRYRYHPRMKIPLLASLFAVAAAGAGAAADHGECSQVMGLKLPDVKVTDAAAIPAAPT